MDIRVGDMVELELSPDISISVFRYEYNHGVHSWIDHGSSGKFAQGLVDAICDGMAVVFFTCPETSRNIPLPESQYYVDGQFELPGFARLVSAIRNDCMCGADKVFGKGTQFHSDWCPKYQRNPYTGK